MTRFQEVIRILDDAIGGPQATIGVHGAFWRGLTRDQFVKKPVRGMLIVTPGDGARSALVLALKGEAPFGADLPDPPPGALFSRMPAAGMTAVENDKIAFIQKWIDDGCLEDEFVPAVAAAGGVFGWHPTNAPVASSRTDDIWFIDARVGWAVNSNGQIIHTTDGGENWTIQLQANAYFRCISMADARNGWAGTLTQPRRLFRTQDGGANWGLVTNLPPLAPSAICGLSVVNAQVAYASGTNDPARPTRMMKTLDGGQTWTAWEMSAWADLLVDCHFTSPTTGWTVGGKRSGGAPTRDNVRPVVLQTLDGGQTWTNRVAGLQFPAGEWGWKIQFVNARLGFVSLENFSAGAILKTTDGGQTWVRLPVNDPQQNANLEGVGFIDENSGWVGGWGDADFARLGSSATSDGGLTWRDANEMGKAINRFRFIGTPLIVGYASGQTVYKYSRVFPAFAAAATAKLRAARDTPLELRRTLSAAPLALPLGRLEIGTKVLVTIYSRFGDEVKTYEAVVEKSPAGPVIAWDLANTAGQRVPAGDYILRFSTSSSVSSTLLQLKGAD